MSGYLQINLKWCVNNISECVSFLDLGEGIIVFFSIFQVFDIFYSILHYFVHIFDQNQIIIFILTFLILVKLTYISQVLKSLIFLGVFVIYRRVRCCLWDIWWKYFLIIKIKSSNRKVMFSLTLSLFKVNITA